MLQVGFILTILLRGKADGVLVPIPQYPLYSATLALQEAQLLGYELNEATGWEMPIEVRRARRPISARPCAPMQMRA